MKKIIVLQATILILFCGIASSFGQTVSEEAKRHNDRGMAAADMAKSPEDFKDAIKEFEQAIRLAPDWPEVYFNLGMVQEKAEKYSDAVTNLKQYLRLAPNASDAEEVKSLINKLEYKKDQEEGVKRVYEMMTSGSYLRKEVDRKVLSGRSDLGSGPLLDFQMVSGKMQVGNYWYYAGGGGDWHPQEHPPIPREWEPVKVNGRFYEYTFSYYMMYMLGSSLYSVRYDSEVKGEIISIDPPKVKEIAKWAVTWGAPIEGNRRPWSANDNYFGASEYIYELIAKDASINAKDKDGYTPLHTAVIEGKKEVAELLIAKGADIKGADVNVK